MQAHRVQGVIRDDGSLLIGNTPFRAGEAVAVIVLAVPNAEAASDRFPLRGKTPYRFDDPFSAAADPGEWEATR